MRQSPWVRAVLLVLLLGALFGLLVWHGSLEPDPSVWALPGAEELGDDYGSYLGERVTVWGQVVQTDPVVIAVHYDVDRVIRLRVVGLDDSLRVSNGDRLNVYGVVEPARKIRVVNVVRIPASGVWYTYAISLLAGLWVLGRLVLHWRVDLETWTLCRRRQPLRVSDWLLSVISGASRDA